MKQQHEDIIIPLIVLRNVSKEYRSNQKSFLALQDISLDIEKNDIYGIIGPSGAGKSTLIRSLASLIVPTSGEILFHGKDITKMGKRELRHFRSRIGMIFQHFNLLSSRTVAGNIAYPLEIAHHSQLNQKRRIGELLDLVGLKDKKNAYPSQLSGGEKQRVGIARALAHHPEILLCDEATSALDPKTTHEILNLLKDIHLHLGITIILITHDMDVIKQICNKVAVIEKGIIVEKGLITDIFAKPHHSTTQYFLQNSPHPIPAEFFKPLSPHRKLLRLRFKGDITSQPIISEMVRRFHVSANILLGWIDRIQTLSIGTLIIELTGEPEGIEKALDHLRDKMVYYEVIENGI